MSVLGNIVLTGPPKIGAYIQGPSGLELSEIVLPKAFTGRHVRGIWTDGTEWQELESGIFFTPSGPKSLPVFSFGYRALDLDVAESLLAILKVRVVIFTPRTYASGIDDPSFSEAEEAFPCRVVGEIPFTRHLTKGFDIDVELEGLAPYLY